MVSKQFVQDFRIRYLAFDVTLLKGVSERRSVQTFHAEVSRCGLHGCDTPRTFGGVDLRGWDWKHTP
ncbi:hypothetical protein FTO74_09015 [Granulicella sp. WH15]|uniref:hypothetical protein n=1 Tax=Granulicella sp. WH15 TaxID=2602070 RepID=UPI001366C873|nr:hypothetical protein [Granulicella sp. WH15]QHN03491.1 hypothetical protein FTO74_09015 [Granulicella sp. WH15]